MSLTKITSPSAGFTGTGATGLEFTDGDAYTASPYEIAFYRDHGYGIGGNPPTTVDSRTVEDIQIGSRLSAGEHRVIDGVEHVLTSDGKGDSDGFGLPSDAGYVWVPVVEKTGELRDAAVDPQPGDYHAPINAGLADPHGPDVRSVPIDGAV